MDNLRKYGNAPFTIAVIHGGPGAPGEMAPVAGELSKTHDVLEPLQTESTIRGQLQELKSVLLENGNLPMALIGHSWGAWLSFIFAARNPSFVKKLILISSGAFEKKYASDILRTRLSRLTEEERIAMESLLKMLGEPNRKDKNKIFAQVGEYISKADSFNPLLDKSEAMECQYDIYESVWKKAKELRSSGELLSFGKLIKCPVVAIHGDYDPHPSEGVKTPLSGILRNFSFVLIENCGHRPWIEKEAKDKFYVILNREL